MSETNGGRTVVDLSDFAPAMQESSTKVTVGMFAGQTVIDFFETDMFAPGKSEVPHTIHEFIL